MFNAFLKHHKNKEHFKERDTFWGADRTKTTHAETDGEVA